MRFALNVIGLLVTILSVPGAWVYHTLQTPQASLTTVSAFCAGYALTLFICLDIKMSQGRTTVTDLLILVAIGVTVLFPPAHVVQHFEVFSLAVSFGALMSIWSYSQSMAIVKLRTRP